VLEGIFGNASARDGGRCTYVSPQGRQCGSAEYLEFHHQVPWARCKEHTISNIALRCRPHNQYEAELAFGTQHMAPFRRRPAADPAVGSPIRESRDILCNAYFGLTTT
jgi:hypothetical protein